MTALALPAPPRRPRCAGALSDLLYTRRGLLLLALLAPPLLWFGVIYLGSLFALLANAFFRLDDFTGQVVREVGFDNFVALLEPANLDAARRSVAMAVAVTLACTVLAFPLAYYMARHARGTQKALLYIAVMLPLWSSYLVRLYAWKLLLAKEGAISWLAERLHATWLLDAVLSVPLIGGPSLELLDAGHLHRLRLHVAAVHGAAGDGGDRAHPGQHAGSLGRPRRAARPHAAPRHPAAGACRASRPGRSSPSA